MIYAIQQSELNSTSSIAKWKNTDITSAMNCFNQNNEKNKNTKQNSISTTLNVECNENCNKLLTFLTISLVHPFERCSL